MHKLLVTHDSDFVPLCMTGRTGNWDMITMRKPYLKIMANIGGIVLGLDGADPLLGSIYNRKYG